MSRPSLDRRWSIYSQLITAGASRSTNVFVGRGGAFVLVVAGLGVVGVLVPVGELRAVVGSVGPAAPALAVLGGALLLVVLVPRTAISLACGALFGPIDGAGLALAAALVAAVATFATGRLLATRSRGDHEIGHPDTGVSHRQLHDHRGLAIRRGRWARVDEWVTRRGVLGVMVVRLMPVAPFGLVGYLYGATAVRPRHYLAGTALAATPSAVSYAVVGAAAVAPSSVDAVTFVPAAIGLAVSAAAALHWRRVGASQ